MSGLARGTYNVVLKASGASTSSTTGATIVIPDGYTRVKVVLSVTAIGTATTPTLNVYIQNAITFPASTDTAGGQMTGTVTFNDLISFAQVLKSTGVQYASLIETTGFINAAQDVALAAGSIRAGVLGNAIRAKWVIAGTTPSYTFSVFAQFLP